MRAFQRVVRRQPDFHAKIERTLKQLAEGFAPKVEFDSKAWRLTKCYQYGNMPCGYSRIQR